MQSEKECRQVGKGEGGAAGETLQLTRGEEGRKLRRPGGARRRL